MIIQLCQMKGRGKCGCPAVNWVRLRWKMYEGEGVVVKAACAKCTGEHEIVDTIEVPA